MSGRGGKQVNYGVYKRGSTARDERDAVWREAYRKKNWQEARSKYGKMLDADAKLLITGGDEVHDERIRNEVLPKYAQVVKGWKKDKSLFAYLDSEEAMETEPEVVNEFFKEYERDWAESFKGYGKAKYD